MVALFVFFFSSRRRHTRYWRDWSSDVCSSDLDVAHGLVKVVTGPGLEVGQRGPQRGAGGVGHTCFLIFRVGTAAIPLRIRAQSGPGSSGSGDVVVTDTAARLRQPPVGVSSPLSA